MHELSRPHREVAAEKRNKTKRRAPANATCASRTTSTAGPGLPSLLLYTEEGGPRQRVAYPQAQLAALREPRCSPEFELIAAACRRRLRSDTQAEFEPNSPRTVKIRLELQKRPWLEFSTIPAKLAWPLVMNTV